MSVEILNLKSVSAFYGKLRAIDDINLKVDAGELVCVIGPNGAGKTTLLKSISRTMGTMKGEVIFCGENTSRMSPQRLVSNGLVHVPEGRQVFGMMSVEDNLRVGAYSRRHSDMGDDLDQIFDLFPKLRERRKQMAVSLSGGEQQMLAIGRALMSKPKLLMLDEPSMGVAPIIVKEIYKEIARLKERQIPILLVEQNAKLALEIADRAMIISAGRIRFSGTAEEIRKDASLRSLVFGH